MYCICGEGEDASLSLSTKIIVSYSIADRSRQHRTQSHTHTKLIIQNLPLYTETVALLSSHAATGNHDTEVASMVSDGQAMGRHCMHTIGERL